MRLRARNAGLAVIALCALEIGSCQVYDSYNTPEDPEGLERAHVETGVGWRVSYLRQEALTADSPRLIYVHGSPGDAASFQEYLLDPVLGCESISIDRPGFGRTRPKRPALSLGEQAQCIEPLLSRSGGMWPVLVGHSLGAAVIVRAALDFPDRVGGIVILSGSLDPALEKAAWYQHAANFALVPYMIPGFLRNSNRELIPLKTELERLAPVLKDVICPVIIVHAPNDFLVPFKNVEFMLQHFPQDIIVDSIVLEGKNHFIPWNAEPAVRDAIERVISAARERITVRQ